MTPHINVRDFGALGDGATDDTLAIRAAIAALPGPGGVLFFPPGRYLTDTIYPPNHITLRGDSAFGYQESGGTVISPVRAFIPRLIDLNGKHGVRMEGLTFHGRDLEGGIVGIFIARGANHEQNVIIDNCRIEHFSGTGVQLNESHVWNLRHSILFANKGHGLDAGTSFDGWIHDCMFVANGGWGVVAGNSISLHGSRIEHNREGGLTVNRYYSQHLQICGNLFCSDHGPSIEMLEGNVRAISITGNTIRNGGRSANGNVDRDCQVRFEGVRGLTFTGNVIHVLWCNTPATGMILKGLQHSVVAQNTLFKGATRELIRDLGGHIDSVIGPNPGCLKDPNDLDS